MIQRTKYIYASQQLQHCPFQDSKQKKVALAHFCVTIATIFIEIFQSSCNKHFIHNNNTHL